MKKIVFFLIGSLVVLLSFSYIVLADSYKSKEIGEESKNSVAEAKVEAEATTLENEAVELKNELEEKFELIKEQPVIIVSNHKELDENSHEEVASAVVLSEREIVDVTKTKSEHEQSSIFEKDTKIEKIKAESDFLSRIQKLEIEIENDQLEIEIKQERKKNNKKTEVEIELENEKLKMKGKQAEDFVSELLLSASITAPDDFHNVVFILLSSFEIDPNTIEYEIKVKTKEKEYEYKHQP